MTLATLAAIPAAPANAAGDPNLNEISDGLGSLSDVLAGLDALDELGNQIPLTNLLPTGNDALDLVDSLAEAISDQLPADPAFADLADLNDFLDANVNTGADGTPLGSGVTAFIDMTASDSPYGLTIDVLKFEFSDSTPIDFQEGEVTLDGGSLDTFFSIVIADTGNALNLEVDTTGPMPEMYVDASEHTMTASFDITAELSTTGFAARLGILDVTVEGTNGAGDDVAVSAGFSMRMLDPDGDGRITNDEWNATAPLDLFDVDYTSSSAVTHLALSSSLNGLAGALGGTATIDLNDTDLSNGLQVDPGDITLNLMSDFTNMSAQDVLATIRQLAISITALQIRTGNIKLPFTNSTLAELVKVNDKILKFFQDIGLSTSDNPLDFTIPDDFLETAGLTTVELILDEFAKTILDDPLADADDLGIAYDPSSNAVTWNIQIANETYTAPTPGAGEKVLGLDFADQLSSVGILGLELDAAAGVSVAPSYGVDMTVGLDLRDEATLATAIGLGAGEVPIITDRVFLDTAGVEFSADAPIEANIELMGTIGILEVGLSDANAGGDVTLIGKRTGDIDPMLEVDIDGGTDDRVSLKDLFAALEADISLASYEGPGAEPKDRGFSLTLDQVDDAQDITVLALFNVAVPSTTLSASAEVGGTPLGAASVTVEWADLLAAETPTITTAGAFNDQLLSFQLDTSDPLALFNQIVDISDTALAIVDDLLLDDPVLNEPLPLVDVSAKDVVGFMSDLRDEINALVSNPAAELAELATVLEAQVLDAIGVPTIPDVPSPFDYIKKDGMVVPPDDPDGVFDLAGFDAAWSTFETDLGTWQSDIEALLGAGAALPDIPDPLDFDDGGEFQLVGFLSALEDFADELLGWITDKAGFIELEYVPAGSDPAALIVHLAIGICSTDKADAACTVKRDLLNTDFNFNLEDYVSTDFGGLVGAEGSGQFDVSYKATANIGLGIELPTVTPGATATDLPTVSGSITPFILDDSKIELEANAGLETDFSARIGPFEIALGDPGTTPEKGSECAMGDDVDDDLDGWINDGCPTQGSPDAEPEDQATQCDNDTDDEDNDLGTDGDQLDGYINDGCDAQGNPVVAKVGAMFTVENEPSPGTADRVYDFSTYASGLTPDLAPSSEANCGEGVKAACAVLPAYLNLDPDDLFLGEINFGIANFDGSGLSLTGVEDIADALAANADALAWELIKEGLQTLQEFLDDATNSSNYGESIPVVGDALDAGVEVAAIFNTRILTPVNDVLIPALEEIDEAVEVEMKLQEFFWEQLYENDPDDTILLSRDASGDPLGIGDAPSGTPTVEDFVNVVARCDTGGGESDCVAGDSTLSIVDVQVQFAIGQSAAATTPPFDFGFPGLRLASEDPLTATVGWRVDVGFGLSFEDGFYLVTGDGGYIGDLAGLGFGGRDAEATISSSIDMPANMEGDLAFIQVNITEKDPEDVDDGGAQTLKEAANDADPGSRELAEATLELAIDITGGGGDGRVGLTELVGGADSLSFEPSLTGGIDVLVGLRTTVNIPDLDDGTIPSLLAVLDLTWSFTGSIEGGLDVGGLEVHMRDIRIDLGSFISDFLAPVLSEVQRYTKPLQPVIDVVSAPVPGLTELAELVGEDPVTLISLFEAISDNDLTMIKRIIELISFVNSIPTNPGEIIIDLGDFEIDKNLLRAPELPASQKGMLAKNRNVVAGDLMNELANTSAPGVSSNFKTQLNASRTGGGFTFPAFEQPTQLFGLLMGDNPTLIRWDAGLLEASMSFSQTFGPIAVGPIPVSLVISGAAGIQGRFAIGYDTKGIRQMVEVLTDDDDSNDGFFSTFGLLFAGIFIDDLDENGNDVPEITLFGELAAGAAVDLVIISAGVEGGVRLTIDMNLHDGGFEDPPDPENLDGKLRIDEIVTFIYNPLCLFDVSGKIEAFIRVFVELDLFLFSKTFRKTIVSITLLDLKNITADLCKPPEPVLATNDGGTLVLNIGPKASDRNFAEEEPDEKVTVRQLGPGKVSVTAFGYYEEHPRSGQPAITKVFADAGDGNDVVVMEAGAVPRVDADGVVVKDGDGNPINDIIPFTIRTEVCGGPGNDRLAGGDGTDTLVGDGKRKGGTYTCTTADQDTDGLDEIGGLGGNDTLWGTGADDIITGDSGNDTIRGGTGNDQISGGFGMDTMYGGSGDTTTDQDFIVDNPGLEVTDDDEILGGPEPDPEGSTDANDTAFGGLGADSIEGDVGDDELHGGPGIDIITGDAGDDDIFGDAGDDMLFGNDGDDTVEGGAGDDDVFGNDDDDTLWGDDSAGSETGNDDVIGGEGEDEIHGGAGYDVLLGDEGTINRNRGAAPPFTPNDPDLPLVQLESTSAALADDTMFGDADPDRMWGQEGDDDMFGGGGDDEMHGNDGADEMHGNSGGDTMFGDGGTDLMFGDDDDPATNVDGADTMRGGTEPDTMYGNADADVMFGDSGNDTMYGDDDDPATGGDGADTMRGGIGNDLMFGNDANDLMFGDADNDRMIGGSSTAGEPDKADNGGQGDNMNGGQGTDVMAGDNATISSATPRLVTLRLDGAGAGDTMAGGTEGDRMFGQTGADHMSGNAGADYVEGNEGSDDIFGNDGGDDLIGGSSAGDGVVDDDRNGSGRPDSGDEIWGGGGADQIAGDNALIDRNFDLGAPDPLVLFDVNSADGSVSGGDYVFGGSGDDAIFGQGNGGQPGGEVDPPDGFDNDLDGATDEDGPVDMAVGARWEGDALFGEAGSDYIEGNHGSDYIVGGSENDDLIGGGSATDSASRGVIDADRIGTGLDDARDTIHGDGGVDWITGDNAQIERVFPLGAANPIVLFDVNSTDTSSSAGDYLRGGDADDVMFGQGNGNQGDQADPIDGGVDNDLDDDVEGTDEDVPWRGDVMFGDAGDDYLEGNHGADLMFGDAGDGSVSGNDDLVGGGSANDDAPAQTGTFVADRNGAGLNDARDVMYGEGGIDWMAGDNAFVERNEDLFGINDFVLFDVNSDDADLSGGDFMDGGPGDDFMVGQGNGGQSAQSDPRDGVDNDGDGDVDEDQAWDGDVMLGGLGEDYMEGNAGADVMFGDDGTAGPAGGPDDMIGGGSANEGDGTSVLILDGAIVDSDRTGHGLNDEGDVMRGEAGEDYMAGDNARIDRSGDLTGLTLATDRSVQLFDVELTGNPLSPLYSGGDWMAGGGGADVMFGQGNGAQSPNQADPLDGVDNDLDGREDGDPNDQADQGWDCGDFGFENDDPPDGADGADPQCVAATDEDMPWRGDVMFGNGGADYMEGNHGSDWMFGNADEDDMVGGGSANDGAIVPDRDPRGLTDGHDVMSGGAEDDVMAGDNASINRVEVAGVWDRITNSGLAVEPGFGAYDQAVRITAMHDGDAGDDTHGNDYLEGNDGNDEMYGQLGDDFAIGGRGDDALLGDLGQVTANVIGDDAGDPDPQDISTNSPHWDARIYELGSMWWETVLFANDTSQGGVGDDDVLLGHDGRDTVFGGPGDDVMNGDGDGTDEFLDAENPEYSHITDIDPTTFDQDMLFGGDDDDALWGGRDNDILLGGHGEDHLDVRPREQGDNGRKGNRFRIIPRDPPEWHAFAFPENFQDKDFIYGGWDRDALQADQAENGPDPGDRLADWAGGYNVFYLCPAGYGDHTILRQGSPHSRAFLQALAEASGAIGAADDGTSGFRELAYVFANQRGSNSHPPHPDHPGHFTCADLSNAQ